MPINWVDVPDPHNPPAGAPKLSAANLARLALIEDIGTAGTATGDAIAAAIAAHGGGGAPTLVQKVALWGDSMLANGGTTDSVPTVVGTALGVPYYNGGVSGQTSTEVALRQGGLDVLLTFPSNQIPAASVWTTLTAVRPSGYWAPAGSWVYTGSVAGVVGTLTFQNPSTWQFKRTTAGSAVNVSPETRWVSDQGGATHSDWVSVFRAGRNNDISDTATMSRDILAMVNGQTSAPRRFIVLPLYNNNGELSGSAGYDNVMAFNTALSNAYGPNYYDMRGWLIRNGLAVAGITPTAQDTTDIGNDYIPSSLRQDGTHLNNIGRIIEGNRLAEIMVGKGWFPSYTPVTVPNGLALSNSAAPAISGTATVGQTLTVSNGTWSATPDSYTYQWKRDGVAISGATSATYVLVTADGSHTVTASVTAVKARYTSATATSSGVTVSSGVFDPAALSSPIVVRYDAQQVTGMADGAAVTTIADTSGNSRTATAAGSGIGFATAGLNGKPAFTFSGGASAFADSVAFPALTGVITIFCVAQYTGATGSSRAIFATNAAGAMMFLGRTGGSNVWYISRNTTALSATATDLLAHRFQEVLGVAGGSSLSIDGTQVITPVSAGSAQPANVRLGAYSDGTQLFQGKIAELIVYNGALTAGEMSQMDAYLVAKWGF